MTEAATITATVDRKELEARFSLCDGMRDL
jgi:hypothetical protein